MRNNLRQDFSHRNFWKFLASSRKFLASFLLTVTVSTTVLADTVTVANFTLINGETTYQLSSERLASLKDSLKMSSEQINEHGVSSYQNVQGFGQVTSWLLEHNILSKDVAVDISFGNLSVSPVAQDFLEPSPNIFVKRSDFLMALCKAFYGVQDSLPVLFRTKASTASEYDEQKDLTLDFSEGNYFVYISPNVYELYLTTLLDKGIISKDSLKNIQFLNEYKALTTSSKPDWFTRADPSRVWNVSQLVGNPLGQTVSVSQSSMISASMTFSQPSFCMDEHITVIEALRLIESVMRQEEDDMTNTEAKIINYKYGVKFLAKLDAETKKTVMYLVAKGILNFENESEFAHLFNSLDSDFFQTLLYRCANKAARKDFSTVQLTDSENYWLGQGLSAYDCEFKGVSDDDVSYTVVNLADTAPGGERSSSILKKRKPKFRDGPTEWKVTLRFRANTNYTYNGTPITDLESNKPDEVDEVSSESDGYIKVTFKIKAASSATAVAIVQTKVSKIDNDPSKSTNSKIDTVASVSADGETTYNYIPKTALQNIKGSDGSQIIPVNDKYLYNSATQTSCILLDDQGTALVGNEIITTDKTIVKGLEGEVYYNLEIIVRLMTKAYISELWDNQVLESSDLDANIYQGVQNIREYTDSNSDNYTTVDKGLLCNFADVRQSEEDPRSDTPMLPTVEKKFLSLLHSQRALNVLYENIQPKTDFIEPVYMVVQWKYVVPGLSEDGASSQLSALNVDNINKRFNRSVFKNGEKGDTTPSVKEMCTYLNTRPSEDAELAKWWDSNIGLSNALCNYLYGTSGVNYCFNGYMAPSVTILSSADYSDDELHEIMGDLPFETSFANEFLDGGATNPIDCLFGQGTGIYGSMAQAREFNYIKGRDVGSIKEFKDYVLDKTGTLYESIGTKGVSAEANGINREFEVYADGESFFTKMVTRDKMENSAVHVGSTYKLKGDDDGEYYCTGQVSPEDNGTLYMKLVRSEPLKGRVQNDNGEKNFYLEDDGPKFDDWTQQVIDEYSEDCFYSSYSEEFKTSFGPQDAGVKSESANVYVHGSNVKDRSYPDRACVINVDSGEDSDFSHSVDDDGDTLEPCVVYPTFYVKKFRFGVEPGSLQLMNQEVSPFTLRENLTHVGISAAMVDAIVAKDYGAVSLTDLADGTKVIIGDLNFVVKSGKLLSYPVKDPTAVAQLQQYGIGKDSLYSTLAQLLTISVSININGRTAEGGQLCEFLRKGSSGSVALDLSKCPVESDKNDKILVKDNGGTKILAGSSSSNYSAGDYFNGFCFSAQFEDAIKFRPLDNSNTVYSLVYVTDYGSNGFLADVPFFTTTLDYHWDDSIFGKLGTNEFKEAADAFGVMQDILDAYSADHSKTIRARLSYYLIMLMTLMIILNFFAPMCKRIPWFNHIFEMLKYPNGRGGVVGVDILSIISFGTVTIDSDNSPAQSIGVIGLLVLALVLFVEFGCKGVLV